MKHFLAAGGTAVCVGSGFMDMLPQLDKVLHTVALLTGIATGIASFIYYWSNRKKQ